MNFKLSLATLPLLLLLAAACESSSGEQDPVPTPSPVPAPAPPPEEPVCPQTHGPTIHGGGDLAANETWTAEGSPHIVESTLRVRNGKTLTIEPCAVVQVAAKTEILVATPGTPNTGAIVAEGTARRPIRIEGKDGATWGQFFIAGPGTARLAYLTLANGGGNSAKAAIVSQGIGAMPTLPTLFVDHVTIDGSASAGVSMSRLSGFAAGSNELVVKGAKGRPLEITEYALTNMPRGRYDGNANDEILLDPEGYVEEDATIRETGVPYLVGTSKGDLIRIGKSDAKRVAALTIEPGVTMRFVENSAIAIELAPGDFPASGVLIARGTADKPIVLTSASPTPKAGDWRGLWFGGQPNANNAVEHVRIEYGGGECLCVLSTCSNTDKSEGAIIFTRQPPSAFITNTTIAHSDSHGIVLGYDGATLDFATTNTFEDLNGCTQTLPRMSTCPSPRPSCN